MEEAGGGRQSRPSHHQEVGWGGPAIQSELPASSPILGLQWQRLPWVLKNQADLSKGTVGLSEAGVRIALSFLLCTELSPGERWGAGVRDSNL